MANQVHRDPMLVTLGAMDLQDNMVSQGLSVGMLS